LCGGGLFVGKVSKKPQMKGRPGSNEGVLILEETPTRETDVEKGGFSGGGVQLRAGERFQGWGRKGGKNNKKGGKKIDENFWWRRARPGLGGETPIAPQSRRGGEKRSGEKALVAKKADSKARRMAEILFSHGTAPIKKVDATNQVKVPPGHGEADRHGVERSKGEISAERLHEMLSQQQRTEEPSSLRNDDYLHSLIEVMPGTKTESGVPYQRIRGALPEIAFAGPIKDGAKNGHIHR